MNQNDFEHQLGLMDTHMAKAEQCIEYGRKDDAKVHLMIARTLREGLEAKFNYEKQALLNTVQSL